MRGRNRERDRALSLLRDGSVWTTEAFRDPGISVRTLRRIVADGFADTPALGLYRSVGSEPSPWDQWAEVTARQPDCVFCLVSAAAYHGITLELPASIQIGIPMRAGHPPRMGDLYPRIEAIRWRNQANLTIGVESHAIGGSEVRITNPTRTAVDVWRYSVLNKAMPSRAQRITEETCADVFSRYLDPDIGGGSAGDLGRMAAQIGCFDGLRPFLAWTSVQNSVSAPRF